MNREVVLPGGAGVYPLTGDVQSMAGNPTVTVTGLQTIPVVAGTPSSGSELQYNFGSNNWEPTLRASIQVNGITVSDDPWISVNVIKPTLVNGA